MDYGYYTFGDEVVAFVAADGSRQAAPYKWENILAEVDREAERSEEVALPIAGYADVVRRFVAEPPPDKRTYDRSLLAEASLAQITLYAASFVGRAARRTHDEFGEHSLVLAEGKADYAAAANLGVVHWAMEGHSQPEREKAGLSSEEVWRLTAMMARSIAQVAPLLQDEAVVGGGVR